MIQFEQWEGFEGRIWKEEVNVRDFIQKNYTPYNGDESFLAGPTEATDKLWGALQVLQKEERAKGGVLDMETEEEEVYAIVGSQEANPMEGCISDDSPFGFALKGHKVGETVTVTAPVGELQFKIIAVENED